MVRLTAHGLLVVDKPRGPTSHDIVARARRVYATRAVGHAGTLDPMATGVLVLLFGEATKLSPYVTQQRKAYRATVRFGRTTDSGDADGVTIDERAVSPGELTRERVDEALATERARTLQVPPSVSAIKVAGVRAHRLSRAGAPPELAARAVEVEALELVTLDESVAVLELTVSKGYYVRALARDLGVALGLPAHLEALRRTASGNFTELEACGWPTDAPLALLPVADAARRALPVLVLTEPAVPLARQGKRLSPEHLMCHEISSIREGEPHAWYSPTGQLIAIGQRLASGELAVIRGFTDASFSA